MSSLLSAGEEEKMKEEQVQKGKGARAEGKGADDLTYFQLLPRPDLALQQEKLNAR